MDSGHNCDETRQYSREYDSYYCESCNCWLEDICTDRDCEFCKTRPVLPLGDPNDNR
jgi:hypothetical protein